jgi:uncharacterized membrane protein
MALAEAILGTVSSVSGVITSFVNNSTTKYALRKSIEAEGISASRKKAVAAYTGLAQMQAILIGGAVLLLIIVIYSKMRKQ